MQTKFLLPLYASCLLLLALTTSSCSSDDNNKSENDGTLSLRFTNPTSGQTISGTVTVSLQAEGTSTPDKIDLYLNDALIETLTITPYSFSWNTTTLTAGAYRLKAVAIDLAGREAEASVQVTLQPSQTQELLTVPVRAGFFHGTNRPEKGYIVITDHDWNLIVSGELQNDKTLTLASNTFTGDDFIVTELYINNDYINATSYLHTAAGTWSLNDPYLLEARNPINVSVNFLTSGANYTVSTNANFSSPSIYSNAFFNELNLLSKDLDLTVSPGKLYVTQYGQGALYFHMYDDNTIVKGGQYKVDLSQINTDDIRYQLLDHPVEVEPGRNATVELFGLTTAGSLQEGFRIGIFQQFDNVLAYFLPPDDFNPFQDYFSITSFTWQNREIENSGFGLYDLSRPEVQATISDETTAGLTFTTSGDLDLFQLTFDVGEDATFVDGTWRVVGPAVNDQHIQAPELPEYIQDALWFTDFKTVRVKGKVRLIDYTSLDSYADITTHIRNTPRGFTALNDKKEKKQVDLDFRN
ncbi:hypothetical protein KK062_07465 [Fulvivirgaceae bacterium PWU5]|uniref:Uncharacterized protein n=1 Tax=Dawidia cretensis TaxID=2782350 RepID=A0AAP2DX90_9BACT|nr:Ig-like domain-containing protein [Dawidia cretensis]MBT1708054.1 hypothetical protein [Dawidia cretensis]